MGALDSSCWRSATSDGHSSAAATLRRGDQAKFKFQFKFKTKAKEKEKEKTEKATESRENGLESAIADGDPLGAKRWRARARRRT